MSLYNKYRPHNFAQLSHNLPPDFVQGKTKHHAYLFFGSPGTGKTSTVRILMTNYCSKSDTQTIINGKHPDYFEINCAVNNGVDDIRSIISDIVNTMPVESEYKFICFDECHMITNQGQNALLKTIEEPPKHVKFFFCTTEVNKVIPAIRSRCTLVPFFKVKDKDIVKILERVCKEEKLEFSDNVLSLIASCSDGSARNSLNLLEQCSGFLNNIDFVATILGTSSQENFYSLTKFICNKDRVNSLKLLEKIFDNSTDPGSLMNKYADFIADKILTRVFNPNECEFDGKKLMILGNCITDILKDFKVLQNIKLISKIHVLKTIEKL